ncbi:hypothetical protein ABZ612_05510 [Streptomyces avermitilis]|uniref:hypothetical protein n=1 Tax=Streptomyces avermitilis TaxID=33903 RepID=UPI0034045DBF
MAQYVEGERMVSLVFLVFPSSGGVVSAGPDLGMADSMGGLIARSASPQADAPKVFGWTTLVAVAVAGRRRRAVPA